MEPSETDTVAIQNSLPNDIALKIASSLQASDLCALASCSRFWRELCASDCIWVSLCRQRWPCFHLRGESSAHTNADSSQTGPIMELKPNRKGWREIYIQVHNEMGRKAATVIKFVEQASSCKSLEVGVYLKVLEHCCLMQLEFEDVQMFLFKPNLSVLHNLVGLHYCITGLGMPAEFIVEALQRNGISERQVCVKWWKLGRWLHRFRLQDESFSRCLSLGDLAGAREEKVLRVLHRGAVHEVSRVQIISVANPTTTSSSHQIAQTHE
ncbi:uncharacterized protein LOC131151644 [Malania oleifera]|uniref:uncharacterized protein LOC131151644 n=1 Tax=Malania oleifera TaxID=397392 RepID=UPI0025AE9B01|nr:uncharacterized protein LOC131151644 [Malania oleifera]